MRTLDPTRWTLTLALAVAITACAATTTPLAAAAAATAPLAATTTDTAPLDAQSAYFPPRGDWEERAPEEVGFTQMAVDSAVAIALAAESGASRDLLENHLGSFGREPFGEAIGPFKDRGPASGLIIKDGYIVAEWGEPDRVDNTFSVTKSFLSSTVGLAYDRGLIADVMDPVAPYMAPVVALIGAPGGEVAPGVTVPASWMGVGPEDSVSAPREGVAFHATEVLEPFASGHNARIRWDDLLRQTSDWQGTLWGKPDWADRPAQDLEADRARERREPGTVFEYNDTRVNLLALAALNLWRRPLPQVLREHLMDPIGASPTWRWMGYDNSWVVIDGELMQSVSGGSHWGGGMFISARDMARFGLFTARGGVWDGERLLSEEWLEMARTPGPANDGYGFMNFFLNSGEGQRFPSGPPEAFFHLGAGNNVIYVDPGRDLVIVARWVNSTRAVDRMVEVLTGGS